MNDTLSQNQIKTLTRFKEGNSLIVNAPRRSGKTFLLRYIAQSYTQKIGILTNFKHEFDRLYGDLKNCEYNNLNAGIILADEIIYYAPRSKHSLSMITGFPNKDKWIIAKDMLLYQQIMEFKKELPEELFLHEFGDHIQQ